MPPTKTIAITPLPQRVAGIEVHARNPRDYDALLKSLRKPRSCRAADQRASAAGSFAASPCSSGLVGAQARPRGRHLALSA